MPAGSSIGCRIFCALGFSRSRAATKMPTISTDCAATRRSSSPAGGCPTPKPICAAAPRPPFGVGRRSFFIPVSERAALLRPLFEDRHAGRAVTVINLENAPRFLRHGRTCAEHAGEQATKHGDPSSNGLHGALPPSGFLLG